MPWYEWDACLSGEWRLYTFLCRDSRFTRRWRSMKRRMDFTRGYAEFLKIKKIKRGWTKLRLPESNETVGQRGDIVFVGTSYSERPPQRAATMERLPSARGPHSIRPFDELHDKVGMTFVRCAAIEQAGNIFMLKAGQNLALCRSQLPSGSRSWRRE